MTSWYPFMRPPFSPYFPAASVGKEYICNAVDHLPSKRRGFDLWVGKICCRRKWQSTPAFLPGESHGQRSLAGYRAESWDMTEVTWHSHVHQCTSNLKDADSSWKQVLDHFHINLDITGPWLAYKALCKLEKGISYKKANHKEVPPLQGWIIDFCLYKMYKLHRHSSSAKQPTKWFK